ncbi:NADH-quinone oxidoreductase subunit NuoF [Dethiobacter alkaliphilus]|uniref:NADH-quinone oxidoreductase subunit NuoF n=1 Tax=Dethiobacter alkaliphilus TaxID=427926 RepID=UPI00222683A8|nr:NADH-quinone oxidoreductase subunit NuoF [Dethiobacter alkaliphilus]MCW3490450.1 NADH-quinone oxidoreductase subunit NuoF [Dethiobacter alkaliphilus]
MENNSREKRKVLVCCGTGCIATNSLDVVGRLQEKITAAGMKTEVEPAVKATGCNGFCENGPIVKILPHHISYYKVQADDVDEIVETTLLQNKVIERLLYRDPVSGKRVRSQQENSFYRRQLKIALRNTGEIDPLNLADYLERDGYLALKKVLFHMEPQEVISEVEISGLRGRGGAGFPTGRKWRTCKNIDSFPKYVVCNGDEGDPGAFMDRSIIEGDPHSIIEGMIICGYALNARQGFIYIRDEYSLAVRTMVEAIKQAEENGFLGENILDSGFSFTVEVVRGGGAFVCGESTALMASIEGKVGEPRAKYIRSVEKGLWGQPTVLNNVETWANIPEIINRGGRWYKSIGTESSPGTKVFSLVGKVKNTGLVEVPMGITLKELIYEIGGGILNNKRFKAVQTGGPSGGCLPESQLSLPVDFDSLEAAGSMMGSGGMIVMDERTCMVDTARYYIDFLAEESCGKCAPCREGLMRMGEILNDICSGNGCDPAIDMLVEIGEMVSEASLCGLGKSAPNPVLSTIKHFREEYEEHFNNKRCPAGVCRELTRFAINVEDCVGCGVCKKQCVADAIAGEPKEAHVINEAACIKCGICIDYCKFNAVAVLGGVPCESQ